MTNQIANERDIEKSSNKIYKKALVVRRGRANREMLKYMEYCVLDD